MFQRFLRIFKLKEKKEQDPCLLEIDAKSNRYTENSKKEKLDFEDFKFLIEVHDEFVFYCQGRKYEIVWYPGQLSFFIYQEDNDEIEREETYSSGKEFLATATINGESLDIALKHWQVTV